MAHTFTQIFKMANVGLNIEGLPSKNDCLYTPHFCEENIWMLVKKIQETNPDKLKFCYPVFISNENSKIPLWRQSVSKQEDGLVVWDYHVIMIYADEENSVVIDFDTQLPFQTKFSEYCEETFRSDELLKPEYHRLFRVVTAKSYLTNFSSDRRHMKRDDETWLKPPPNYPVINNGEVSHNLPCYKSMIEKPDSEGKFGNVLNLKSFVERFSAFKKFRLPENYFYPPDPLQPSWLE